jgi:cytochrome c oxidase cbb3-type subunit III
VTEARGSDPALCSRSSGEGLHLLSHCILPLCALLLGLSVCFGAPASWQAQAEPSSSSSIATGRQIFTTTCAACHGLDGRGGEHAPNIATRADVRRLTDQQIFRIVHDGAASGAMPAFGSTFSAAQIHAVVQYLRALQGAQSAAKLPGDPLAGKALFFGNAGCGGCHMVQGQGGFIADDLTDYAASKSVPEIRAAITAPAADPRRRDRLATITTTSGERLQGMVRNEDNFSLQLQALDGSYHLLDKSKVRSVTYDANSLMPSDYGTKLSSAEIDAIVSYLMSSASTSSAGNPQPRSKQARKEDE